MAALTIEMVYVTMCQFPGSGFKILAVSSCYLENSLRALSLHERTPATLLERPHGESWKVQGEGHGPN